MNYLTLFTMPNLALLSDWLASTGELYVDIYLPHSGASSTGYFVCSLEQLKALIAQQNHTELEITIFRERQYPLRGIANEELLAQALTQIPDGSWYNIIAMADDVYPGEISYYGGGNGHGELRQELEAVFDMPVAIGIDFNSYAEQQDARDVFKVVVRRNQGAYEPYATAPDRYAWLETLWNQ